MPEQGLSADQQEQVHEVEARLEEADWYPASLEAMLGDKQVIITKITSLRSLRQTALAYAYVPDVGYFVFGEELGEVTREEALAKGLLVTERNYYVPVELMFTEEYQWTRM
jgi:hypothetical protein